MALSMRNSVLAALLLWCFSEIVTSVRNTEKEVASIHSISGFVDGHAELAALDYLHVKIRDRLAQRADVNNMGSGRSQDAQIEAMWKQAMRGEGKNMNDDLFSKALAQIGNPLDADEKNKVWKALNKQTITNAEFHETIEPKTMPPVRTALVTEYFEILDKDHDDDVTVEELGGHDALFNAITKGGKSTDGKIHLANFLAYYRTISALIDNDDYFELMFANAWRWCRGGDCQKVNTANLRVLLTHKNGNERVVAIERELGMEHNVEAIAERLQEQGEDLTDVKISW